MNIAYTERVRKRWKWVIGQTAFVAGKMTSYKEKFFKMKKGEEFDWSSINVDGGNDNQKVLDLVKELQKFGGSSPHKKSCGLDKIARWLRANGEPSMKKMVVKVPPEIARKNG